MRVTLGNTGKRAILRAWKNLKRMFRKFATAMLGLLLPVLAHSIELPANFVDEAYISGLAGQVTGFDQTAPGRVFIAEKAGVVRVARDGVLLEQAFLDIRDSVNDRVDRGLLGVAVHPQFPSVPYVYVLYTYDPPELQVNDRAGPGALDGNGNRVARLVRYSADAAQDYTVALQDSATVILGRNSTFEAIGDPTGRYDTQIPSCGPIGNPTRDCLPIDELSHTIGAVRFAPDGSLYVTNGDGASYHSVEQMTVMTYDLDSLRGKILRIDPITGNGLPDNPYFDGDSGSNRSRVVSAGLRNPYSLTIHPLTGVPYVGDVGWDLWEEINAGHAQNFGWPCYSGGPLQNIRRPGFEDLDFCQTYYESSEQITSPVLSWERNDAGAAMVGDFYFGEVYPDNFTGKLFYADFLQGWMRYADVDDAANVISYEFATDMLPMTEIKVGADGAVYYASITTGEIRRIRYVAAAGGTTLDTGDTGSGSGSSNGSISGSPTESAADSDAGGSTTNDTANSRVSVGALPPTSLFLLLLATVITHTRNRLRVDEIN